MEALLWKTKLDTDILLLHDLHKRGNAKGGRGERYTSISTHLKSYQKIDEPKGHADNKVGRCPVQSPPCHSHSFTVIKQSFGHSWNSEGSTRTLSHTQPANATIMLYIRTQNLPGLNFSKVTPIQAQNVYSFSLPLETKILAAVFFQILIHCNS
jgi:hypothetical protein